MDLNPRNVMQYLEMIASGVDPGVLRYIRTKGVHVCSDLFWLVRLI